METAPEDVGQLAQRAQEVVVLDQRAGYKGVIAQSANREIGVPGGTKNEGLAARAFGPVPTLRASGQAKRGRLRRRHRAKRQSGDWRSRGNQKRRLGGTCVWPRPYASCLRASEAGQATKASPCKAPIGRLAFPGEPKTKAWRHVRLAPPLRFVPQGKRSGAGDEGVTVQSANREIGVPGRIKNEGET